jgi:prophage antirepressor-like protein
MNQIKTENWNGNEIRFVWNNGEWWAVAVDVCNALGLNNVSMAVNGNKKTNNKGLRNFEKGIIKHDTLGGEQELLIVSEPGIYRLVFKSRKQEAESFQDWVYNMLKELRELSGLEGFQVFRMLDKEHQKEAMNKLRDGLKKPVRVNFIKANTIADKATSSMSGYPKMIKKGDMTPDMLLKRQPVLEDTVELMTAVDKFNLECSVSEKIYEKYH